MKRTLPPLVCLVLACDRGEPPAPETRTEAPPPAPVADVKAAPEVPPTPPTPATPPAPAVPATPPGPAGPPGPAYFAVDDQGIVRLDGGKFTRLAGGPKQLIKGMQVGGDGALWVVGYEDVLRLEGDRFRRVARAGFDELGASIDDIAVTPGGEVWAATFKGVARWDGKAWKVEDKAVLGERDALLRGVALDRAGDPWVATTHRLHVRTGGAWKAVDLGPLAAGRELFFEGVRAAPDGTVLALASTTLLRLGPGPAQVAAVAVPGQSVSSFGALAVSSNGAVALKNYDDVVVIPAGGEPRVYESRDEKHLRADNIRAVGVDDTGRAWVGSDLGVSVVGPGEARTEWPGGSVPELVGSVVGIVVVGSGPASLPASGAVRKGGLTGKVVRDGSPLAQVPVELCPSPAMIFSESPCADAPVKFVGTTDDRGNWTFQDVPIGSYGVAVKPGDKWQITFGGRVGEGMKEGKVYDTGTLVLGK
jgi:hypothetical protein